MDEQTLFAQTAGAIGLAVLLALISFWVARRNGFFRLPPKPAFFPVTLAQTLGAFGIYLLVALFTFPLLALAAKTLFPAYNPDRRDGWVALAQVIMAGALVGYCYWIRADSRREIFWGNLPASKRRFWKGVGLGALTWLISYPFVLLINSLAVLLERIIWGKIVVEQVAVSELKATMDRPWIFVLMLIVVALIVPFVEELLFRGFLQSYLRRYLGRGWAIVAASAIFAIVHYSPQQHEGNFQLILSLFTLSLFISFIYERERTLWAPVALHATFNSLSAFWISIS